MQIKHIELKVKQVKAKIEKTTKQSIALYGATICSDGWNNVIDECHVGLPRKGHIHWISKYN